MQADDSPLSDSSDSLSDALFTLRSIFLEGKQFRPVFSGLPVPFIIVPAFA